MLHRMTSRVSPASVIATIALFAALGGGYATAFSGSGTLQKAAVDSLPTDSFADVRSLTGFGVLQAKCEATEDAIKLRFNNTTSPESQLFITGTNLNGDLIGQFVSAGVGPEFEIGGNGQVRLHLSKTSAGSKAQVDVVVSGGAQGSCMGPDLVRVMALNTQQ